MSSEEAIKDFPEEKQKLAVAYSKWKQYREDDMSLFDHYISKVYNEEPIFLDSKLLPKLQGESDDEIKSKDKESLSAEIERLKKEANVRKRELFDTSTQYEYQTGKEYLDNFNKEILRRSEIFKNIK